jgi:hypothetical protein
MSDPQHPIRYKKGGTLFDSEGNKFKIADVCTRQGVVFASLSNQESDKMIFIEYDMQDYDGKGGEKLPEYYRLKPKQNGEIHASNN